MKIPNIVAELGCVHNGNVITAKSMIEVLCEYGIKYVKLQKRTIELMSKKEYNRPVDPGKYFGSIYGEHRKHLEFSINEHIYLKNICDILGVTLFSSVWDINACIDILSTNPQHIKIPSAHNNNFDLLNYVYKNFKGIVHISLGMTSRKEEKMLIKLIKKYKAIERTVLYHCVAEYPLSYENVRVGEITRIKNDYPDLYGVGFSSHSPKICTSDYIACVLGIDWIERHFTLIPHTKGSDNKVALSSELMWKLKNDIEKLGTIMKDKDGKVLDCEKVFRKGYKYGAK